METRTFNQLIARVIEKGATNIELNRSSSGCGCIQKGDINAVIVYFDTLQDEKSEFYFCYRMSACNVFDNPTIKIEKLYREKVTNRCITSNDIKEFAYSK